MLEREREAAGVAADLIGLFAPSVGSGLEQLAEDCGADLLLVGSCRRGSIGRLLRGDDTQGSLGGARCAVAVAPVGYAKRQQRIETIGVAYNGSPESEAALAAARALAAQHDATIAAMTVVWPTGRALTFVALEEAARDRLQALGGVEPRVEVGPPEGELLAFGDQLDLLVVGSRGHGPLRRLLLGSTSAHLVRYACCPVLVLPRTETPTSRSSARSATVRD